MPPLVVPAHGRGALRAGGTPGNAGGTGRPPNWLRDFCDGLLADKKCKAQVRAILRDKKHPAFATMWGKVADRAQGKPAQSVQVTGRDGEPLISIDTIRAALADAGE